MLKILIPTAFDRSSRSGIRFAIQWARQQKAMLVFFHVAYIPCLTGWSEDQCKSFRRRQMDLRQRRLKKMATDMLAQCGARLQPIECVLVEGISPESSLQDYCREHKDIDFICMGTDGAAGLQRLWGTHAGNMITQAPVAVVVVPRGYRTKAISRLLYATDLNHYQEELKNIVPLARRLGTELHILHLVGPDERVPDRILFEKVIKQEFHVECQIHLVIMDETRSVASNLNKFIRQMKPSLVIMFTDQQRTVFEKIFFPSKTESYAFRTRTPLLTMPKQKAG